MSKWTQISYDEDKMEEKILLPYKYLKPLRIYDFLATKLPESYNYWLRIPKDKLKAIQEILVKLNHSFAILDDIQDDSLYRRTQPTAHRVFGKPFASNTGMHLLLLVLEDINKLGHPKGADIYCRNYLKYIRGTGAALYWQEHHEWDVKPEDHYQMMFNQTGSEILMMQELMQLFSDNKDQRDYECLSKMFAVYVQLRDEYVDLMKPEAVEIGTHMSGLQELSTMTFCKDFTEGKMSAPVIHALKSPHRDVILGILKMRTHDLKAKKYLLSLLKEAGGIQKTKEILREIEADILAEVRRLGDNPVFEEMMRDLRSWDEQDE
ncbi:geranylgeranyl pyrophosphate synthase-like [Aricia agestis]|uniref:geranylgeranyl pyrophosphate synthase-like n=1 Tax=Aricia agestis TaxID=91739 RepID=UPI001C20B4F0|nr:geranylgeranyl pyrophosphate synthase-like [Aricia agestis]